MVKLPDKIIVVDIESTCWMGEPPQGQESEIIEIGLCLLDVKSGQRIVKQSILVRPERSTISEFCTRLTTLTQDKVASGVTFSAACATLREEFQTRERVWASFGDYDRRQFIRQCHARGVPYPFGPTHVNVKNLFALALGLQKEVSLADAFDLLGLELEGTYHRGDDDAWNIAAVLAKLLQRLRGF